MDKPEQTTTCPQCGFTAHLSSYDTYSRTATYVCERYKEIFKKAY